MAKASGFTPLSGKSYYEMGQSQKALALQQEPGDHAKEEISLGNRGFLLEHEGDIPQWGYCKFRA